MHFKKDIWKHVGKHNIYHYVQAFSSSKNVKNNNNNFILRHASHHQMLKNIHAFVFSISKFVHYNNQTNNIINK